MSQISLHLRLSVFGNYLHKNMSTNKEFLESRLGFWTNLLKDAMLVEGKHWPEDYINVALNMLKKDGKYVDDTKDPKKAEASRKIKADVQKIAQRFRMVLHGNSPLGYFNVIVRWYAEDPKDFVKPLLDNGQVPDDKLEAVLQHLLNFLNNQALVEKHGQQVKNGDMSFKDFSSMMKRVSDEDKARADSAEFEVKDNGYQIIPFISYEDLHSQFGGSKTGYRGESEWCHTNGESTYESWTENFKKFFFVIAKDDWQEIKPHDNPQKTDNAYDEYGLSLMAILVTREGELLKCTLRWNHVVEPSATKPGRAVDNAFISFAELSQVTGFDVEAEVKRELAKIFETLKRIPGGKKIYEGPEGLCFARDHFYWYDRDFNPIDPPDEINGEINCYDTKITSLEGSPRVVNRGFDCSFRDVTSLEGGPQIVNYIFSCSHTKITSLKGAPVEVKEYFDCSDTKITSLEDCPKKVGGSFYCQRTNITSLEGIPKNIHNMVDCSETKMTSLEGAPESVANDFKFGSSDLTSLEGAPRIVGANFIGVDCDNLSSFRGAPAKVKNVYFFDTHLDEIENQQLSDYREWLKTNPTENYPG